ncbi:MAG: HAD-IA family hydrolase [Planctomycetaceae bacterium]
MSKARDSLGISWPERIRAIAFDAVGTLIHPVPPVAAIYAEIGRRHGSRLAHDEIARRFRDAFAQSEAETPDDPADWDRLDRRRCDEAGERNRWRTIVTTVLEDADDPDACFEELFAHFAQPSAWAAFPDVTDALTELRERGLRTAIASNFDARLLGLCREMPELREIDAKIVSSLVGYRKPSGAFYRALVDACDVDADEIVMVGDDWTNDVLGARRAGLQAVLLRRDARHGSNPGAPKPTAIRSLRALSGILVAR